MARGFAPPTSQRVVGFASEVQSIREPRQDELSVMSHFARHANRCPHCHDPFTAYKQDKSLCDRGINLAIDVCKYLYAKGGKPFSVIDRQAGDRIQVQVPADMEAVTSLIKAIDHKMVLRKKPAVVVAGKVEVEKIDRAPHYSSRTEPTVKVVRKSEHSDERRYRDGAFNILEISPRRHERSERVYQSGRTEDRSRHERTERVERPKTVIYPSEGRGSLYQRDEEDKRQRRRYETEPIVIVAEPKRHSYISRRYLD